MPMGRQPFLRQSRAASSSPPITCPLQRFVDDILVEGLTLLAGKPKKGKSYLALDMSLSIAVGRQAFLKFPTRHSQVLYVSLEDGERRIKRRLLAIQHNLTTPDGLDFLFAFPRLGDGALEALTHYAATYQVIIIDILGRILPPQIPMSKSLSEYQQFMDLLGPIQKMAEHLNIAIVLIDHIRKASADDDIDTIIGSQGKGGSADHVLIYARKGEEKDGVLKVTGRDLDDDKFVLSSRRWPSGISRERGNLRTRLRAKQDHHHSRRRTSPDEHSRHYESHGHSGR